MGGCLPRIEVIVKMQAKVGDGPVGGQDGCEPRIEVIVKIQMKCRGFGGGGVGG